MRAAAHPCSGFCGRLKALATDEHGHRKMQKTRRKGAPVHDVLEAKVDQLSHPNRALLRKDTQALNNLAPAKMEGGTNDLFRQRPSGARALASPMTSPRFDKPTAGTQDTQRTRNAAETPSGGNWAIEANGRAGSGA